MIGAEYVKIRFWPVQVLVVGVRIIRGIVQSSKISKSRKVCIFSDPFITFP